MIKKQVNTWKFTDCIDVESVYEASVKLATRGVKNITPIAILKEVNASPGCLGYVTERLFELWRADKIKFWRYAGDDYDKSEFGFSHG